MPILDCISITLHRELVNSERIIRLVVSKEIIIVKSKRGARLWIYNNEIKVKLVPVARTIKGISIDKLLH